MIIDVDMMMTRSRTLAAAPADAVTLSNSNSMVIVNKQAQTRSHHILRGIKRSPSSSPHSSSRRSRSQVAKKYLIRITMVVVQICLCCFLYLSLSKFFFLCVEKEVLYSSGRRLCIILE